MLFQEWQQDGGVAKGFAPGTRDSTIADYTARLQISQDHPEELAG
jgi:hypothetical protein